jgi:hypothetical protein
MLHNHLRFLNASQVQWNVLFRWQRNLHVARWVTRACPSAASAAVNFSVCCFAGLMEPSHLNIPGHPRRPESGSSGSPWRFNVKNAVGRGKMRFISWLYKTKRFFPTNINGHFRNLNWRYLPYVRPM